jgi:hypothetical protein
MSIMMARLLSGWSRAVVELIRSSDAVSQKNNSRAPAVVVPNRWSGRLI